MAEVKPQATLLTLALAVSAWGASATPTVLRAERDVYGHAAQQALVFETERAVLTRNSNFLCKPSSEARLGVFTATYDRRRGLQRDLALETAARLVEPVHSKGKLPESGSPHSTRFYVGGTDVTLLPAHGDTAREILLEACENKDWRPTKAVLVALRHVGGQTYLEIAPLAGPKAQSKVPLEQAGCASLGGGIWDCPVEGFGRAFLTVPGIPPGSE